MTARNSSVHARRMSAMLGLVAADEASVGAEELAVRLEDPRDRFLCGLSRAFLVLVRSLRRRDLARVAGEAQTRIRRARDERVEHAHRVEVRAVGHRAATEVGRVEVVAPLAAREVHHHGAALAEDALRELVRLDRRRQPGRVLRQVLVSLRLAPDVLLLEREPGGPHEDADGHVVHAGREHVQLQRTWPTSEVACHAEHIPVSERRKVVGRLVSRLVSRPRRAGLRRNDDEGKPIDGDQATDDDGQAPARAEGAGEAREEAGEEAGGRGDEAGDRVRRAAGGDTSRSRRSRTNAPT